MHCVFVHCVVELGITLDTVSIGCGEVILHSGKMLTESNLYRDMHEYPLLACLHFRRTMIGSFGNWFRMEAAIEKE